MTIFESNTGHMYLNKQIIGFSGYSHSRLKRNQIMDPPHVIRIKSENYLIILYYNPAVRSFHLPQDAVGLILKNSLTFGLADGVSIVKGIKNNHSALISYDCIRHLPKLKSNPWRKEIEALANKFATPHFIGASTCVWGRIAHSPITTKLKIFFVGDEADFGMKYLISPSGKVNLQNESHGFLPSHYSFYSSEVYLPPQSTLVFSTDGVLIDEQDLNQITEELIDRPYVDTLKTIQGLIKPNEDDQSMLIIHHLHS